MNENREDSMEETMEENTEEIGQNRKFRCMVEEGERSGIVTVWVDSAAVDRLGDDAVIASAKHKWRQMTGPAIDTQEAHVQVLLAEEMRLLRTEEVAKPTVQSESILQRRALQRHFDPRELRSAEDWMIELEGEKIGC